MQQAGFALYRKIILKLLKNFLLWFNHVAVFTVISWSDYAEILMNFGVKSQNSRDDNLFKSDVQVDIHLKLLLIKLNPAVFLLIAKC